MCNDKQKISIVRGTTNGFSIAITDEETGNDYELEPGEIIRFGVKTLPTDENYVFTKEITEANESGEYGFTITPSDTSALNFGAYWYDAGLQSGGAYYNIIPAAPFELTYNVTEWEA